MHIEKNTGCMKMANSLFEIAIFLVVILMIFGVILTSYESAGEKIVKAQEINNIEKMLVEVGDNLINNPGVPENWNEYEKGTPGLAIINDDGNIVANSVSYSKLIALGKNYDKLVYEKLFNSKIKTSIEIIPQKSSIASVKIGDYEEGDEIYAVNRMVKCDFYKSYVLKDFQNEGKCNHNHDQKENSCNYFKIFKGNVKNSDYYLIIDDSEKNDIDYIIDTTRVVKERYWQSPTSNKIYLNPQIDFYDDTSAIVFVHLNKADAKAVLVSVPKNFEPSNLEYDYFKTSECEFILTAWY